jgi:hypothetical protein
VLEEHVDLPEHLRRRDNTPPEFHDPGPDA